MTRAELGELGLENLIGTEALRAYMHGYFMDNKLYQRAKMVAKPSMYEEYQKEKNRKKDKERKERRITLNHKKPEVNAELAARLKASGGLADQRFKALFQNPDFEIDKSSEEFRRTHASGMGKRAESDEEAESEAGSAGSADSDGEVFGEDFELLNTHDGENRTRRSKETGADSDSDASDASDASDGSEAERAERAEHTGGEDQYVGKKKRKEREEKERIKPKGVRFFGVKENTKINLAASKQEVEKEAAKRKEKRTMSLGKRMQGLEKRK